MIYLREIEKSEQFCVLLLWNSRKSYYNSTFSIVVGIFFSFVLCAYIVISKQCHRMTFIFHRIFNFGTISKNWWTKTKQRRKTGFMKNILKWMWIMIWHLSYAKRKEKISAHCFRRASLVLNFAFLNMGKSIDAFFILLATKASVDIKILHDSIVI